MSDAVDREELYEVMQALGGFKEYIMENYGEKIDVSLVQAYAKMQYQILAALNPFEEID